MSSKKIAGIIIGANGGIGSAVLDRFIADPELDIVIAVSRDPGYRDRRVWWYSADYTESSIASVSDDLSQHELSIRYIVIATGILHDKIRGVLPEKRIASLQLNALENVFSANTFTPILWLKNLSPLLNKNQRTNIAVLSARVGSISDNYLGGWYSYRASKAALNMLLKSLAIEFKLRFPRVKITAFHPGTTDTTLSKPFQKNIPEEKIFSTNFVAEQLHKVLRESTPDGDLSFLDWKHQSVDW
jgi:NAD(P)-dependent dehydrogenase (short-subunit alcohol dehydrogenase family)